MHMLLNLDIFRNCGDLQHLTQQALFMEDIPDFLAEKFLFCQQK